MRLVSFKESVLAGYGRQVASYMVTVMSPAHCGDLYLSSFRWLRSIGSAAASGFSFSSAFSRNLSTSVASCILRSIISSVRNSDFLQLNFMHCCIAFIIYLLVCNILACMHTSKYIIKAMQQCMKVQLEKICKNDIVNVTGNR